jgi:GxxExxY protein
MSKLIHKELSYLVQGILIKVYNQLGPQLPEKFYQQAITFGLQKQGIHCIPEKDFIVAYRNQTAGFFQIDHWLEQGQIILEIKVDSAIKPLHKAQTISYLKLTQADLAIIANFGTKSLQYERLPNFIRNKSVDFQWQPKTRTENTPYPEWLDLIFEALHRVHFTLGPGFIHRVYRQAVMIELQHQNIPFQFFQKLPLYFDQNYIGELNAQIIQVNQKILLGVFALKTIDEMMGVIMKKRMNMLGMKVGVLANYYGEKLEVEVLMS